MAEPKSQTIDFSAKEPGRIVMLDKGSLLRLIGVRGLFSIGYADVSSSVYYALGVTILYTMGLAPLALGICSLFFICTVLTYAELSTAIPEPGGSQAFARRAFNDLTSFIAGWALLLDYVITVAISIYTIGPHLAYFDRLSVLGLPHGNLLLILALAAGLAAINIVGIRESTRMSFALAMLGLVISLVIVGAGFFLSFDPQKALGQIQWGIKPTWEQFLYGIPIAMVTFVGIEALAQLAGEVREPERKLPRALFLTCLPVILVAVALPLLALSQYNHDEFAAKYLEKPLIGVVEGIPGVSQILAPCVAVMGAVILFVATNAGLIGASRLAYSMARNFQLPAFFSKLHPRSRTPYLSITLFAALAVLLILFALHRADPFAQGGHSALRVLVDVYSFGAMLAFALAHLSLIGLRWKEPDLRRPFKIPGSIRFRGREIPLCAVLGLVGTGGAWLVVVVDKPPARWMGLAWMALGFLLYYGFRSKGKMPIVESLEIERIPIPEFQETKIGKILVPTLGGESTETVQAACRLAKDYGAELTALYVMQVPLTLDIDTLMGDKFAMGTRALKRAEAIGHEYRLAVRTKLLQSRSVAPTILELAREEQFDLIVIGAALRSTGSTAGLGKIVDEVLRSAPCRVWVCASTLGKFPEGHPPGKAPVVRSSPTDTPGE